ncbi:MAG TPA: hypothetical protein VIA29_05785 [Thermoanaerobaculia bacterium]
MTEIRRRLTGVLVGTLPAAAAAGLQTAPPSVTPTPEPTPPPAAAPPVVAAPLAAATGSTSSSAGGVALPGSFVPSRITETITPPPPTLPKDNPYGAAVESPAALPPKLTFGEWPSEATLFASVKVDRTGKAGTVRIVRDPLPGISRLVASSLGRWTFTPARQGGQPADAWASLRVDLNLQIDEPKVERQTLTPVKKDDALPSPILRGKDDDWYDTLPPGTPEDGVAPVEKLDAPPVPNKTRWDADSWRGAFTMKFWIQVDAAGRIVRAIPLEASDPGLVPYFRRAIAGWTLKPGRVAGAAASTWNELVLGGQIRYDASIKQIQTLRKTLPPPPAAAAAAPVSR